MTEEKAKRVEAVAVREAYKAEAAAIAEAKERGKAFEFHEQLGAWLRGHNAVWERATFLHASHPDLFETEFPPIE